MDGIEFYSFLQQTFHQTGEVICDEFTFQEWAQTNDGTVALRFAAPNGTAKLLPKDILVAAWDADTYIRDSWLMDKVFPDRPDDCRLQLLDCLLRMCSPLRQLTA